MDGKIITYKNRLEIKIISIFYTIIFGGLFIYVLISDVVSHNEFFFENLLKLLLGFSPFLVILWIIARYKIVFDFDKKEYKDIIISLYKKVKFSFNSYESLTSDAIDFMMTKKKDMPDEILYIIYYNDYCAFNREYIVKCMNKRNLLTDSIKEELHYDSDYEIRRYVSRYVK